MYNNTLVIHGVMTDDATSEIYVYDGPVKGKGSNLKSLEDEPSGGGGVKGGYLEIDTDFTLNGLLDIADGDVLIHGVFGTSATGSVLITSGSLIADAPNHAKGWEYLYGNLSLTTGLFEITNNSIHFEAGATTTISGGTIRTGGAFNAIDPGVFQPTGGVTEIIGDNTDVNIYCYGGNYFYDLEILRSATNYCDFETGDVTVVNDFTISSGQLRQHVPIFNVGGDWTNNVGDSGFDEGTYTVIFNGTGDVAINNPETFYNLTLDKATTGDWLTLTDDVIVLNDFVIDGGALHTDNNAIDVSGNVNVNSGGVLFVQAGGTLLVGDNNAITAAFGSYFYVEGGPSNYATVTHSGTGRFACDIFGEIAGNWAIFEYMGVNGVNVLPSGNVNSTYTFNNCIFRAGAGPSAALLELHQDQTFTCYNAYFENTYGNTGANVWKHEDNGNFTFSGATGDFAGPEYEYDPHTPPGHIHWTDMDVELDLTVMLEGPYNGSGMNTDLRNLDLIPNSQPFNVPGTVWEYSGTEFAGSIPTNAVDWVLVKIKDATDAASSASAPVVAEQAAFVLNDGSIVNFNSSSNLNFSGISYSNGLFPVVYQRNHLGVISSDKMPRPGGVYTWDFSVAGAAYSNTNPGEKHLSGGVYGMFSGDGSGGGWVNSYDLEFVWPDDAGLQDYLPGDFNLDSQVDNVDKNDFLIPNLDNSSQIPGSKNSGDN